MDTRDNKTDTERLEEIKRELRDIAIQRQAFKVSLASLDVREHNLFQEMSVIHRPMVETKLSRRLTTVGTCKFTYPNGSVCGQPTTNQVPKRNGYRYECRHHDVHSGMNEKQVDIMDEFLNG